MIWLIFLPLLAAAAVSAEDKSISFEMRVPEYKVSGLDSYVCTTLPLPDKPHRLVGVEPLAEQSVVHHILLFGCDKPFRMPGTDKKSVAWDCRGAPTCAGNSETVMYGWGKNAPKLDLPKGVGFSVGGSSSIKWIVAQVHYLGERPPGDKSGVRLRLQETPIPFSAGLLSYASWFSIPPGKPHYLVQNSCCYRGFQPLTTFAVRVHTHTMGRVVFMTRPKRNGTGMDRLAMGDPLAPQGFNPVKPHRIMPGDHLTVSCDFDSSKQTKAVSAGPTHEHEMCNMYLMVYSPLPHIEMCSDGMGITDDSSPGNMPRSAAIVPDPFPLWKPFDPKDKAPNGKGVIGAVVSVAMGNDGTLWVLTRGGRVWKGDTFNGADKVTFGEPIRSPVVYQMHPDTGKILRSWGAGIFYLPHMITIDRDNAVWVTDVGLHQVLKFSDTGRLLMALGSKLEPGHNTTTFCKPTQVDFMSNGHIMVSDGYCNSRVVRYTPEGKYHCQYQLPGGDGKKKGHKEEGGGSGMGVAHSVLVQECDGLVWVADRENKRVHGFDIKTHNLLETVDLSAFGRVWALRAGPYGRVLALCWDEGNDMALVDLKRHGDVSWHVPDTANTWPHDFALGPAALPLTGASDRLFAIYVAPTCQEGCGPLRKYVMFPAAYEQPKEILPEASVPPVLAHLGGHHHHNHKEGQEQPVEDEEGPGEAETPEEAEKEEEADVEADKQAEAAEEEKEKEEEAPEVVKNLTASLQEVEKELKNASMVTKVGEQERYETINNRDYVKDARSGWKGFLQIAALSVMLGAFVGAFAYHMLHKYVHGTKDGEASLVGGRAFARHSAQQESSNIGHMLDEEEARERDMLLANGRSRGLSNGV